MPENGEPHAVATHLGDVRLCQPGDLQEIDLHHLPEHLRLCRQASLELCSGLSDEDMAAQSMADASPTKWHLAHTTWFFETMVLSAADPGREAFHPEFNFLFNSYYNVLGPRQSRPQRGLLTRPPLSQVLDYRRVIDEQLSDLLGSGRVSPELVARVELGLHHEQQHQELMLTDIKHLFSGNPLFPHYRQYSLPDQPTCGSGGFASGPPPTNRPTNRIPDAASPTYWHPFDEGIYQVGYSGKAFHFDNESPRHRVFLEPFAMADCLVTNRQFLEFIEDGGYQTAQWWLDLGWAAVQSEHWESPLYWTSRDGEWFEFRLDGLQPLEFAAPVCHLSYFEAEAFARWAEARLPTEVEWEIAASQLSIEGNFAESSWLHPQPALPVKEELGLPRQMYGDVWEWTASSYSPYPGHVPWGGAIGEYNGKFMCNQYVLRGGSCASATTHLRPTYRNFFPPQARWQFSGLRLARSLGRFTFHEA